MQTHPCYCPQKKLLEGNVCYTCLSVHSWVSLRGSRYWFLVAVTETGGRHTNFKVRYNEQARVQDFFTIVKLIPSLKEKCLWTKNAKWRGRNKRHRKKVKEILTFEDLYLHSPHFHVTTAWHTMGTQLLMALVDMYSGSTEVKYMWLAVLALLAAHSDVLMPTVLLL